MARARLAGSPDWMGNARPIKVGCESSIGKRTKKMPEPTKTEKWMGNQITLTSQDGIVLPTSIAAQLHHQCRIGFLSHAVQ